LNNIIRAERPYDLDVSQERASQRVAIENVEQREYRLEEQRRSRTLELNNYLPTYKCAVTASEQYHQFVFRDCRVNPCRSLKILGTIIGTLIFYHRIRKLKIIFIFSQISNETLRFRGTPVGKR